jgi:hypothetical protein
MESGKMKEQASILRSKTQKPFRLEISEGTCASVEKWVEDERMVGSQYLWQGRFREQMHIRPANMHGSSAIASHQSVFEANVWHTFNAKH